MICLNCKKNFYVKRSFLRLFETKQYYICDTCRKGNPLDPKVEHILLENYQLTIISLLRNPFYFTYDSYCDEFCRIASYIFLKHSNYFLLVLDKINLLDITIEVLSFLADAEKKDILVICFQLKK